MRTTVRCCGRISPEIGERLHSWLSVTIHAWWLWQGDIGAMISIHENLGDPAHGDVALVFVDTIALPYYNLSPSMAAQTIATDTNELQDLVGAGMSRILSVAKTRTEVLIVAEWTSSIGIDRLRQAVHPDALALAVAALADTIADAHESGRVLGLDDNRANLRISSDGRLYNAFPVVLPNASQRKDYDALLVAAESLFHNVPVIPANLAAIVDRAKRVQTADFDEQVSPARRFANQLRAAALGPDSSEFPAINPDTASRTTVDVKQSPTGRAKSRTRSFSIGAVVVGLVIVGAIIAAATYGLLNRSSDAPINSDSVRRAPSAAVGLTTLPLSEATEWQADTENPEAGPDNPDRAVLTIDSDAASYWVSSNYLSQFGNTPADFKPGVGIRVVLDQVATVKKVDVLATPGARIEVRGLSNADSTDLAETTVLGSATTTAGTTTIEIDSSDATWNYLVIWVSQLPTAAESVVGQANPSLAGDQVVADQFPDSLVPVAIGDIQVRGSF